jgi:ABC-2 type transport system permease protein
MKNTKNKSSKRRLQNYFQPIMTFTKSNLLRFFRDKTYIFFMLILPAMFLILFGMLYGNQTSVNFPAAIINSSDSEIAETIIEVMTSEDGLITQVEVADRAEAEEMLIRGEIVSIIEFPADFGQVNENGSITGEISVTSSMGSEQVGQTAAAVLSGITTEINTEITGQPPNFTISTQTLNREGLTNFDYVFAGLLGYTILTIGLIGIANILPGDKESGATKRLRATVATSSQLIIGYSLTFLAIGVLMFLIMIALGLFVFDFNMRGSWLTFSIFTIISTVMMLGFGLTIGGWAKNEAQASALANIAMFPMMFLSGVFFPLFMMPELVQTIAGFIPLTPIVEGIRLIITENYSLIDVAPQLGIIAIWGVVIYVVAIKTFRWE